MTGSAESSRRFEFSPTQNYRNDDAFFGCNNERCVSPLILRDSFAFDLVDPLVSVVSAIIRGSREWQLNAKIASFEYSDVSTIQPILSYAAPYVACRRPVPS